MVHLWVSQRLSPKGQRMAGLFDPSADPTEEFSTVTSGSFALLDLFGLVLAKSKSTANS